MKKIKIPMMILLGLLYSCSPVAAQTYFSKKPVICGTTEEIINQVKKYGELPFLKGNGVSLKEDGKYAASSYIMGFNQKTGTFTIIEVLTTGTACILGNGKGLQMFSAEKGTNL